MTSPLQLGNVGMGSSMAGGVLKAFAAGFAGSSQVQMYKYQAGIAKLQSQIATQNANYSFQTGEENAAKYGIQAAQRMGAITAAQGASGLDVGSFSAQQVRAGQQKITDMDLAQIKTNAARQAYGYESEAAVDRAKAGLYKSAARNVEAAIPINIAASLISSGGSVADKWYQGKSVGLYSANSDSSDVPFYAPDDL
jgi:hypothetical protein